MIKLTFSGYRNATNKYQTQIEDLNKKSEYIFSNYMKMGIVKDYLPQKVRNCIFLSRKRKDGVFMKLLVLII